MLLLLVSLTTRGLSGCGSRNQAAVAVPKPTPWWVRRHLAKVDEARSGRFQLVFVGDSITQNYEQQLGPDFQAIWHDFFAPRDALNLGFNGDGTQNALWRLRHGEVAGLAPKNVVVLIGTNNLADLGTSVNELTAGIIAVVEEVHARMPRARVLVIGILPTGFGPERETRAKAVNAAVAAWVSRQDYARPVDVSAVFLDRGHLRTELFYDPDYGLPALHPNARGQRLMAERVAAALDAP